MEICLNDLPTAVTECDECGEIKDCYLFEVCSDMDMEDCKSHNTCHECLIGKGD